MQLKGQEAEFYSSKLFTQLRTRMINLIGKDNETFRDYQQHLEVLGINLHSYLMPGMDDAFGEAIQGEDPSTNRTNEQLDVIILRLVKAQAEAWAHTKGM